MLSALSDRELNEQISSNVEGANEELTALVAERSRRLGFDIELTLECILESAQRGKRMDYSGIPDQRPRSWSERRYQIPMHLQDVILHCKANSLPLLSSIIVPQKNLDTGEMEGGTLHGFTEGAKAASYSFGDPLLFLKEQQRLSFKHADIVHRVQRTFLITWKEDGWPVSELEKLLEQFGKNSTATEDWRMRSHKECAIGDKVYALKQGKGPKVIFGVGEVLGSAFEKEWEGKNQWFAPVKFSQLVHPLRNFLINEEQVREILPSKLIQQQGSGTPIARSFALKLGALITSSPQAGEDWTDHELDALVRSYFEMLRLQIDDQPYSKKEKREKLLKVLARSSGSIEFKHQNVSAVLDALGKTWITGYKPRAHAQDALKIKVENLLQDEPDFDEQITKTEFDLSALPKLADILVPRPESKGMPNKGSPSRSSTGAGYNAAERAAQNKRLGTSGEEFIMALEQGHLNDAGRSDLAAKVEWVADTRNDREGYDILSFDEEGNERWIEVKTTNQHIGTPFFITRHELEVSNENPEQYWIYRLFDFPDSPKLYRLQPPFEDTMTLEPISWRVWP